MMFRTKAGMWIMSALALASVGCAANQQQRITTLERTNRNLTERLNRTQNVLSSGERERSQIDQRLLAAIGEVESLRAQLEDRPIPDSVPAGWTPVPGGAMISIEGNILFTPGQPKLRTEARRILDSVVSALRGNYADKDILVFGHTDDTPIRKSGWKDNYELSAQRALSVVRYLGENGLPFERLIACGCGEHRPRVANQSDADRSKNRRVEIFAIDSL